MIEPALQQESEGIRPGAIWAVGLAVVAVTALLVGIAWWLTAPRPTGAYATAESPLKRDLLERATGGADVHAVAAQRLQRTEWVDRKAGLVRIPIDRAIDAVVADPKLIGAQLRTSGAVSRAAGAAPAEVAP
jgi:hypothetical protein